MTAKTRTEDSKLTCILLIDDDDATNYYHKLIIDELEIAEQVQICIDGNDAMNYLTNQGKYADPQISYPCPDLIFLDINMPGMGGFEFLENYHQLPTAQKGDFVIIMLSTSLMEDDRTRAESYPEVSAFKNKPLDEAYLKELMATYWGRSGA